MSLVNDFPWFKLFISAQYIIVKFIQRHIICSQLNINVYIFLFIGTRLCVTQTFAHPTSIVEYLCKIYV